MMTMINVLQVTLHFHTIEVQFTSHSKEMKGYGKNLRWYTVGFSVIQISEIDLVSMHRRGVLSDLCTSIHNGCVIVELEMLVVKCRQLLNKEHFLLCCFWALHVCYQCSTRLLCWLSARNIEQYLALMVIQFLSYCALQFRLWQEFLHRYALYVYFLLWFQSLLSVEQKMLFSSAPGTISQVAISA